jgi:hypothetical protein
VLFLCDDRHIGLLGVLASEICSSELADNALEPRESLVKCRDSGRRSTYRDEVGCCALHPLLPLGWFEWRCGVRLLLRLLLPLLPLLASLLDDVCDGHTKRLALRLCDRLCNSSGADVCHGLPLLLPLLGWLRGRLGCGCRCDLLCEGAAWRHRLLSSHNPDHRRRGCRSLCRRHKLLRFGSNGTRLASCCTPLHPCRL